MIAAVSAAALTPAPNADRPAVSPPITGTTRPRAVYSRDPRDPWNRIFDELFARTVRIRVTEEFSEGAPFALPEDMPFPLHLRLGRRLFERVEDGDRAIEALYPTFMTWSGPGEALREPRLSRLRRALAEALDETIARPALDRALMQSDLWSAYDTLVPLSGTPARSQAAWMVLPLLARLIEKVALTPGQIATLPDNYASAVRSQGLPDLFSEGSAWTEVVWFRRRMHDEAVHLRRVARVFVKPSTAVADPQAFLDDLARRNDGDASGLAGVALVIQNLVVDAGGHVVPSPLTYDVQTRLFRRGTGGALLGTDIVEYELSRQRLRTSPATGGLNLFTDTDPAYMPMAGNDYSFATPLHDRRGETPPVLTTLRTRCGACHGRRDALAVTTFSMTHAGDEPLPAVTRLRQPNHRRALEVAAQKAAREDFQRLIREWKAR
ncbi:MAG: hypothetical protein DMF78_17075 [Acidobacteria bacterium]|nr:MAG: hypothetical protein DMF78_17075 [Acidobacteriota bacterium]